MLIPLAYSDPRFICNQSESCAYATNYKLLQNKHPLINILFFTLVLLFTYMCIYPTADARSTL